MFREVSVWTKFCNDVYKSNYPTDFGLLNPAKCSHFQTHQKYPMIDWQYPAHNYLMRFALYARSLCGATASQATQKESGGRIVGTAKAKQGCASDCVLSWFLSR